MKRRFSCPVCRFNGFHTLFWAKDRMFGLAGKFRVVRCRSCGLVSLFPIPEAKQLARYYPARRYYAYDSRKKEGVFLKMRAYLVRLRYDPSLAARLMRSLLPEVPAMPTPVRRGNILDVGCGTADTLVLLKEFGWHTFGLERDKRAVEVARNRGVDDVKLGVYQDIARYPDRFFDVIRLYHVIEHIDDPLLCLRLIQKKLKKGGELIIGTPNEASLVSRLFGTYWYNLDTPRHVVLFCPKTLRHAVVEAGFGEVNIAFCSAGGLLGSVQYVLKETFHIDWNLVHTPLFVLLLYPIEWMLDALRMGDVFVLRARRLWL